MMFIVILFVVCVGGGWLIGKLIGVALFGSREKGMTFVDNSVHYHEHKHINIIDGEVKKNVYEIIERE